jgi:hypothetical protein
MADILATIGLDHQQFKRGLSRAREMAARDSSSIAKNLQRAGDFARINAGEKIFKRVFGFASSAVKAFAKDNADAQATLSRWGSAGESVKKGIGGDLVALLDTLDGILARMRRLEELRGRIVDATATAMLGVAEGGNTVTDVNQQRAAAAEQAESFARMRRLQEAGLKFGADANEAAGNTTAAAAFREQLRHREELQKIGKMADKEEAAALLENENKLHAIKMAHLEREKKAKSDEWAENKRQLQESQEVEAMRLAGRDREADVMEAELRIAEQIRKVQNDQSLSASQRATRVQSLQFLQRVAGEQAGRKFDNDFNTKRGRALSGFAEGLAGDQISLLEAQGQKELAELAGIRLDAEKRIAEIREESTISATEKEQLINQTLESRDRILSATVEGQIDELERELRRKRRGADFREVEAGIGGAVIGQGLSFGIGRENSDKDQRSIEERLDKLREIEARGFDRLAGLLERGVPATAA